MHEEKQACKLTNKAKGKELHEEDKACKSTCFGVDTENQNKNERSDNITHCVQSTSSMKEPKLQTSQPKLQNCKYCGKATAGLLKNHQRVCKMNRTAARICQYCGVFSTDPKQHERLHCSMKRHGRHGQNSKKEARRENETEDDRQQEGEPAEKEEEEESERLRLDATDQPGTYTCGRCCMKFEVLSNYEKHIQTCDHVMVVSEPASKRFDTMVLPTAYTCGRCLMKFELLSDYEKHIQRCDFVTVSRKQDRGTIVCFECENVYPSASSMLGHYYMDHVFKTCNECGDNGFPDEETLKMHMKLECSAKYGSVKSKEDNVSNESDNDTSTTSGVTQDAMANEDNTSDESDNDTGTSGVTQKVLGKEDNKSNGNATGDITERNRCPDCKLDFSSAEAFSQHRSVVAESTSQFPQRCILCSTSNIFMTECVALQHKKENRYKCIFCGLHTKTLKRQALHIIIIHKMARLQAAVVKCSSCHRPFGSSDVGQPCNDLLQRHVAYNNMVTERLETKCFSCGEEFETPELLDEHSEKFIWYCGLCNAHVQTKTILYHHHRVYHESMRNKAVAIVRNREGPILAVKRNVCAHCNRSFEKASELSAHVKAVLESNGKLVCSYEYDNNICLRCGMSFDSHEEFITHMRVMGLICWLCHKHYNTYNRIEFSLHINEHGGELSSYGFDNSNLVICEHCKTCFDNENELKMHRFNNSSVVCETCEVCGEKFETICQKRFHKRKHFFEREHLRKSEEKLCVYCESWFEDEDALKQHQVLMSTPQYCEICGDTLQVSCQKAFHDRKHTMKSATENTEEDPILEEENNSVLKEEKDRSSQEDVILQEENVATKGMLTCKEKTEEEDVTSEEGEKLCVYCESWFLNKKSLTRHQVLLSTPQECNTCGDLLQMSCQRAFHTGKHKEKRHAADQEQQDPVSQDEKDPNLQEEKDDSLMAVKELQREIEDLLSLDPFSQEKDPILPEENDLITPELKDPILQQDDQISQQEMDPISHQETSLISQQEKDPIFQQEKDPVSQQEKDPSLQQQKDPSSRQEMDPISQQEKDPILRQEMDPSSHQDTLTDFPLTCIYCLVKFPTPKLYYYHKINLTRMPCTSKERKRLCKDCGEDLVMECQFEKHLKMHGDKSTTNQGLPEHRSVPECEHCKKKFLSFHQFCLHESESKELAEAVSCYYCEEKASATCVLKMHEETHTRIGQKCPRCFKSVEKKNRTSHIQALPEGVICCKICQQKAVTVCQKKCHEATYLFSCQECMMHFTNLEEKTMHDFNSHWKKRQKTKHDVDTHQEKSESTAQSLQVGSKPRPGDSNSTIRPLSDNLGQKSWPDEGGCDLEATTKSVHERVSDWENPRYDDCDSEAVTISASEGGLDQESLPDEDCLDHENREEQTDWTHVVVSDEDEEIKSEKEDAQEEHSPLEQIHANESTAKPNRQIVCKFCHRSFANSLVYYNHLNNKDDGWKKAWSHPAISIQCVDCKVSFHSSCQKKLHDRLVCDICGEHFDHFMKCSIHKKKCNLQEKSAEALNKLVADRIKKYTNSKGSSRVKRTCKACKTTSKNPRSLKTHITNSVKQMYRLQWNCLGCRKQKSLTATDISCTLRAHLDVVERTWCQKCQIHFTTFDKLVKHDKQYKLLCTICKMHFRSEASLHKHEKLHQTQCSICHITFKSKNEKREHTENVHTIHWSRMESHVNSVSFDHMYLAEKVERGERPSKTGISPPGIAVEVTEMQNISRLPVPPGAQTSTDYSSQSRQTSQQRPATFTEPSNVPVHFALVGKKLVRIPMPSEGLQMSTDISPQSTQKSQLIATSGTVPSNMTVQVAEMQNISRLPVPPGAQMSTDFSLQSRQTSQQKPATVQFSVKGKNISKILAPSPGAQTSTGFSLQSRQTSQQKSATCTKPSNVSVQFAVWGEKLSRIPMPSEGLQMSTDISPQSTQKSQLSATSGTVPSNMTVQVAEMQNISRLPVPPGAQLSTDFSPQSTQTSEQRPSTSTLPSNVSVQVGVKGKNISKILAPSEGVQTSTDVSRQSRQTSQQSPSTHTLPPNMTVQFTELPKKMSSLPKPSGFSTDLAPHSGRMSESSLQQSPATHTLLSNMSVEFADLKKKISSLQKLPSSSTDHNPQNKAEKVPQTGTANQENRNTTFGPGPYKMPALMALQTAVEVQKNISRHQVPAGIQTSTDLPPQSGQTRETSQQSSASCTLSHSNMSVQCAEFEKKIPGLSKLSSSSTDFPPQNRAGKVQPNGTADGLQSGSQLVDTNQRQCAKSFKSLVTQQRINPVVSATVVELPGSYKLGVYYDPKDGCHTVKLSIPDNCIPSYSEVANVGDTNFFITVVWISKTANQTCEFSSVKKFVLKFIPGLSVKKLTEHKSTLKPCSYTIHLTASKGSPLTGEQQPVSLFL